jgi:hypothetical protein
VEVIDGVLELGRRRRPPLAIAVIVLPRTCRDRRSGTDRARGGRDLADRANDVSQSTDGR